MNASYADPNTLRDGDLSAIATLLQTQRARALDVVATADKISSYHGTIQIDGTEAHIDESGVTETAGSYSLTRSAEAQLAERLNIPLAYMRRMRTTALELWDDNVNGWLAGNEYLASTEPVYPVRPMDPRKFLLRLLRGDDGGEGIIRAVLSDQYKIIDNLDVLLAVLAGVRESGTEITIEGTDLTEHRMNLRISAPAIAAMAPNLLAGYRSPFDGPGGAVRVGAGGGWTVENARAAAAAEGQGYKPGEEPIIFAGFQVSNSDTGHGSFSITPRLVVKICRNGLTVTADVMRSVHLGGKLDEGVIRWSDDTQRKHLDLVTARARDAVNTFLSPDFLTKTVDALEEQAGAPVRDAAGTVEKLAKKFAFTENEAGSILDHFIAGGQLTAGGIMQAVSSVAQTIVDGDAAAQLEAQAIPAMAFAAAL